MSRKVFSLCALFRISKKVILCSRKNYYRYRSMTLVLSLLTLLLIGKGNGDEIQSERYVLITSSSSSQLHLKVCASNGSIETCGTWCYPHLYSNCSSHFFIRSINKETGVKGKYTFHACMHMHKISMNSACTCTAVASNIQNESFFQIWNHYKCNCHSEQNPNTSGRDLFTSIVIGLEGVLILLVIVMTIGWIWTCKIAIKRGKLIKKNGKIKLLSYTGQVKV